MTARARLLLDLAMFGVLFIAYNPAWSGIAWHEWLSVLVIVPLLFHVIINWDKVLRVLATFADRLLHRSRLDLVVDTGLFVATVTVMVSGLMISQVVARAFGVTIVPSRIWVDVHSVSADFTIGLLLAHLALHWRWVFNVSRRLGGRPAPGPRAAHAGVRAAVGRSPEAGALADLRAEVSRLRPPAAAGLPGAPRPLAPAHVPVRDLDHDPYRGAPR